MCRWPRPVVSIGREDALNTKKADTFALPHFVFLGWCNWRRLDIVENPYGAPRPTESQNPPSNKNEIPKTPKTPIIPKSKRYHPESKRSFPKSKRSFPKSKRSVFLLGSDSGRTDFSRIFIFEPPDFFADFLAGFFPLIFVGKRAQKNPPGKSPAKSSKIDTTKILQHISADWPGQFLGNF